MVKISWCNSSQNVMCVDDFLGCEKSLDKDAGVKGQWDKKFDFYLCIFNFPKSLQ